MKTEAHLSGLFQMVGVLSIHKPGGIKEQFF